MDLIQNRYFGKSYFSYIQMDMESTKQATYPYLFINLLPNQTSSTVVCGKIKTKSRRKMLGGLKDAPWSPLSIART